MTRLEDKQKRGLPPAPAPPRRSANPWKFSETARKQEPRPERSSPTLLEDLLKQAPAEEESPQAPAPGGKKGARTGMWLLAIAAVAVVIVLRVLFEAGDSGEWVKAIGPLLVIAFVAHGWWRARQKRSESEKIRKG